MYDVRDYIKFSVNCSGSSWIHKPKDKICSAHFIGNAKGLEELSPSYIPSIFFGTAEPVITVSQDNKIKR